MNRKPLAILLLAGAASLAAGGIASAAVRDDGGIRHETEVRPVGTEVHHETDVGPRGTEHPTEATEAPHADGPEPGDDNGHGTEPGDDHGTEPEPKHPTTTMATPDPTLAPAPTVAPRPATPTPTAPKADDSKRGPSSNRGPGNNNAPPATTATTRPVTTPTTVDDHGVDLPGHDATPDDSGHGGGSGKGGRH